MTHDLEHIADGLTDGERSRLSYGRLDWRDDEWQDHCGDPSCEICPGLIPDPAPHRLSDADQAVRALISKETNND